MNNEGQVEFEQELMVKNNLTLFDQAKSLQVVDDATCGQAEQMMVAIKTGSNKWIEFWEPMRKSADETKKGILEKINLFSLKATGINKAKEAYTALSRKTSSYRQEQDRIRREAAEKIRQEELKKEEDARLAAAEAAENSGDVELAEAIIEQPVYVAPPKPVEVPKTQGVSYTERWKHEVISLGDLVRAVTEGKAPLQALKADDSFLGQQARAMKQENLYPGVRAYSEKTPNIRGAR